MKIAFSFDDGRIDAYNASKILNEYGLTGSFHITTGFIDGTFTTDAFGVGRKPLTRDMIAEMIADNMDISSHGDKHLMETNDFLQSLSKIRAMGILDKKIGFSVPNSKYNDLELNRFVLDNINNLMYVRVGRANECYSFLNKVRYVLYHHGLPLYRFFRDFNKSNLISCFDSNKITSLVIKKDTKVKHVCKFIQDNELNDQILVLMFHSIVPIPKNEWEFSLSDFKTICSFLSERKDKIKVLTLKEMSI